MWWQLVKEQRLKHAPLPPLCQYHCTTRDELSRHLADSGRSPLPLRRVRMRRLVSEQHEGPPAVPCGARVKPRRAGCCVWGGAADAAVYQVPKDPRRHSHAGLCRRAWLQKSLRSARRSAGRMSSSSQMRGKRIQNAEAADRLGAPQDAGKVLGGRGRLGAPDKELEVPLLPAFRGWSAAGCRQLPPCSTDSYQSDCLVALLINLHAEAMGDIAKLATQLTPVESLRAVVLLEEALKQLTFLGRLAKDPKSVKGDQIVGAAGDEIIRIIGQQQELGEMYATWHPQTTAVRRQEVDQKLNNVSTKLKEANRDLCRNLRQTPNIQAKRRNREMMQAVRLLEAELKKEAAEYAENRRVSSVEISELKEELQKLRTKAAIKLAFQEKALMAQHEGMQWLHRQEEKQQEDELLELRREAEMDSFIYNTSTEFHTNLIKQEEEDRIARETAAAEQRAAWICMQRQQQAERETQAARALQHFARAFLLRTQEAEKRAKNAKKKGKGKKTK
ncbi:hypothetical protein ACSSS7_001660 [Eimeria intestinalis]